jgi:hypothetical protein
VARILSISTDLMLGSKVEETLRAAGHEVTTSASIQAADLEGVELVVADLDAGSPETLVAAGIPVLGYYSHVDVETKRVAEATGIDLAVPRSRMARELPALVDRLLSAG